MTAFDDSFHVGIGCYRHSFVLPVYSAILFHGIISHTWLPKEISLSVDTYELDVNK